MARVNRTSWVTANTTAAIGNGSATVGAGVGWKDTGNVAGLPLFKVVSNKLINYENSPGTYAFDNTSNACIRNGDAVAADCQAFVKGSATDFMGIILRHSATTPASFSCAVIGTDFYIFAKDTAGSNFLGFTKTQPVGVPVPAGGIVRGKITTSGTIAIVRVAICGPTALDFTDAGANPDAVVELASYETTIDCSTRLYLLDPGYMGVYMHNNGEAVDFASFIPDTALAIGTPTLNYATGDVVSINVPVASGGTGAKTYEVKRGGVVIASGVATGEYVNTTGLAPSGDYSYTVTVTDSLSDTATSAPLRVLTMPEGGIVGIGVGNSNLDPGFGISAANKVLYKFSAKLTARNKPNVIFNHALAGMKAQDWASDTGGILTAAVAKAALVRATDAFIQLGTNDAKVTGQRSKASYKADLQTIIAAFRAVRPSIRVHFAAGPYMEPGTTWDATSNTRMTEYIAAQAELAAADGTGKTLVLDATFNALSQTNKVAYGLATPDDPHYNDSAHTVEADLWFNSFEFLPVSSGGAGGGSGMVPTSGYFDMIVGESAPPGVLASAVGVRVSATGVYEFIDTLGNYQSVTINAGLDNTIMSKVISGAGIVQLALGR